MLTAVYSILSTWWSLRMFFSQYTTVICTQEAKYLKRWPSTTSAWAGWSRFDIPVNRYDGVHSLLICTSSILGSPTCHQASQQDNTYWAKYPKRTGPALCVLFDMHLHLNHLPGALDYFQRWQVSEQSSHKIHVLTSICFRRTWCLHIKGYVLYRSIFLVSTVYGCPQR
jgi:hypothetical protein